VRRSSLTNRYRVHLGVNLLGVCHQHRINGLLHFGASLKRDARQLAGLFESLKICGVVARLGSGLFTCSDATAFQVGDRLRKVMPEYASGRIVIACSVSTDGEMPGVSGVRLLEEPRPACRPLPISRGPADDLRTVMNGIVECAG